MKMFKHILALWCLLALAACGGGGGSAGTSPIGGGSGTGVTPVATNLVVTLDKSNIDNNGTATVSATALATTSSGQAITGVPVTFSVDNNAVFTVAGTATDATGSLIAQVQIGADRSNRIVTVTATSGALTATAAFAVTGASLTGTAVPAIALPGSQNNRVDFRLVDANASPMVNQAISVAAGSLGTVTGVTGASGDFSYTFTAPTAPGTLDITATAGGVSNTQTVLIQSSSTSVDPVTANIVSASVAANPSVVATNTADTNNRVEIRALFLGANNAPIKNVRVRFDLAGDPSSIGGTFSTGDNVVYSDANGIATTAYIPGARSSPTNGLTVRACYSKTDFATCADTGTNTSTTLTVVSGALSVSIGANEIVYTGTADLTYQRKFVVQVADSAGNAKANVGIVSSVDIDRYYKGQYVRQATWVQGYVSDPTTTPVTLAPAPAYECLNEDINRNAALEAGEDINNDGVLEPRKADVLVSMPNGSTTDASGLAIVQIEYPKNLGSWARVKILVSANGVSGTEGRATWTEVLPVPSTAITATGSPAFQVSPYGYQIFDTSSVKTTTPAGASNYQYVSMASSVVAANTVTLVRADGTVSNFSVPITLGLNDGDVATASDGTVTERKQVTPCENPN